MFYSIFSRIKPPCRKQIKLGHAPLAHPPLGAILWRSGTWILLRPQLLARIRIQHHLANAAKARGHVAIIGGNRRDSFVGSIRVWGSQQTKREQKRLPRGLIGANIQPCPNWSTCVCVCAVFDSPSLPFSIHALMDLAVSLCSATAHPLFHNNQAFGKYNPSSQVEHANSSHMLFLGRGPPLFSPKYWLTKVGPSMWRT